MEKYESYEWIKIPTDLPRENLVLITAKTTKSTFHPEDPEYTIRIFKPEELKEAARSLAQRPVGLNHGPIINGAFTVDANWNDEEQAIEALLYLPAPWINKVKGKEIKKVSVEYTWRNERRTTEGVIFEGFVFNRVDLLTSMRPGDSDTRLQPLMEGKRGLMEGVIDMGEDEVEQSEIDKEAREHPELVAKYGIEIAKQIALDHKKIKGEGVQQDTIQASIDISSLSFFKTEEEACEFFKALGEPFAGYKDFDDCVAKNPNKENPKAYCATIMRKVEKPKVESLATMRMNENLPIEYSIDDIPAPELEEAEKVDGYTPPEAGTLPQAGKDILAGAYASCRKDNPDYSKERCSKIAWGAVKNAGYSKEDNKWVKKEAEPQPTGLVPTPQDMPSDVTVNPDNPKEPFKQIPEQPLNAMASEPAPLTPTPTPQGQEPEVGVTSIGAIADKDTGGPLGMEQAPPLGVQPQVGIGTPLVESTDTPPQDPKPPETKSPVTPPATPPPITPAPIVEPPVIPPTPPIIEPKPDDKDNRIKELEGAVIRLQGNVKELETTKEKDVKEAVKKTKREILQEIKGVLPSENIMSNFNRGGQILANDIKKILHKAKEEGILD